MLDAQVRRLIDPPLNQAAAGLAGIRVGANAVTIGGFTLGLAAIVAVALHHFIPALLLLLLNRLADGLDGAIARRDEITDLGGFLDIVLDFIVYAGVVFGFAIADPTANALAAAFLIFSFVGTGSSFLAFAIMAARRQVDTTTRGRKSLYYLGGLTEGTETIAFFVAFCLLPAAFPALATGFGLLCWITTASRVLSAFAMLR